MTTWLLLVPLLFNAVGGLALSSAAEGASPKGAELTAQVVMVCTVGGMVAVDLDGAGPSDTSSPGGRSGLCPFCLPLMHAGAGIAPSMAAVPAPTPVTPSHCLPPPVNSPSPSSVAAPSLARAPPAIV